MTRSLCSIALFAAIALFATRDRALTVENAHAYFENLVSRNDIWRSFSLRPRAGFPAGTPYYENQLKTRAQGGYASCNSCPTQVSYDPSTDTDPNRQDAAKVVIPITTNSLRNQVRVPMGTQDGNVYLTTWDGYWTPSYLPSVTGLTNHKAFQFGSDGIWFEVRTRFDGGSLANGGSGPLPGFNSSQHIAAIDGRTYNSLGGVLPWSANPASNPYAWAGPTITRATPILPQTGTFIIKANTWTRFWVKVDQRANDYDYVTLWAADESTNAVMIINSAPLSTRGATIEDFWLEFDTSTDTVAPRAVMVNYVRNIVMLRNVVDIPALLVRPSPGEALPPLPTGPPRPSAPSNLRIIPGIPGL